MAIVREGLIKDEVLGLSHFYMSAETPVSKLLLKPVISCQHLLMVSTRKRKLKLAKNIVEKQQKVVNPAARDLVMKS